MDTVVPLGGPLTVGDVAGILGVSSAGAMANRGPALRPPLTQGVLNGSPQPSARGTLAVNDPTKVSEQRQMPDIGPMQGQLFTNPQISPQVPQGAPRPFAPGEYVKNPDGSWSSEITGTIEQGQYPELNGGRATIVPTLWIVNGVPTRVDEDTAASYAVQSGLPFQSFESNAAAEAYSQQREDLWQTMPPEQAGQVPSLWAPPPVGGQ